MEQTVQKKFVTNLLFLLFVNLAIKPIWILGVDRWVQNELGSGEYGIYVLLLNLSFLPGILLDLGINNYNNKTIAQNNHLVPEYLPRTLALKSVLGLLYFLVLGIIGYFQLRYDQNFERALHILLFLGINQVLIFTLLYLRTNLSGLHLFAIDSIVSILDRSIMLILALILMFVPYLRQFLSLETFVYVQTIGYLATVLIAFAVVHYKVHGKTTLKQSPILIWDPIFNKKLLKDTLPYAVLIFLMTLYNRFDPIMMKNLLGEFEGTLQAGIYQHGFRLLDAGNMIPFLFASILLPTFAKMIKDQQSVEQVVKIAYSLLFTGTIIVAFCCSFYSEEIMDKLIYNVKERAYIGEASQIFRILIFCFVAVSMSYIFGTLLTAKGALKHLNIMAMCGLVINIGLNLILIPHYKGLGAAISSLITQTLTAGLQILMCTQLFQFRINKKLILRSVVFVIGMIGLGFVSQLLPIENWQIRFVLYAGSAGLFAIAIKLINIHSLTQFIKYRLKS